MHSKNFFEHYYYVHLSINFLKNELYFVYFLKYKKSPHLILFKLIILVTLHTHENAIYTQTNKLTKQYILG